MTKAEFENLTNEAREAVRFSSDLAAMMKHPAGQKIVSAGKEVLPWIFERMNLLGIQTEPWYPFLREITGTSVVTPEIRGNIREIRARWLDWGRHNGYLA